MTVLWDSAGGRVQSMGAAGRATPNSCHQGTHSQTPALQGVSFVEAYLTFESSKSGEQPGGILGPFKLHPGLLDMLLGTAVGRMMPLWDVTPFYVSHVA